MDPAQQASKINLLLGLTFRNITLTKTDDFEISRLHIEYYKKSCGNQGASTWNEIPKQIRDSVSMSSDVRLREFLR